MQSIQFDNSGFAGLMKYMDGLPEAFKSAKKTFLMSAGAIVETSVDINIAGRINDGSGHVQGWQRLYYGSGGGYTAMRAVKGGVAGNNPGAITNYLENGHAIAHYKNRRILLWSKRKYSQTEGRAQAFGFYAAAKALSVQKVGALVEQARAALKQMIGD